MARQRLVTAGVAPSAGGAIDLEAVFEGMQRNHAPGHGTRSLQSLIRSNAELLWAYKTAMHVAGLPLPPGLTEDTMDWGLLIGRLVLVPGIFDFVAQHDRNFRDFGNGGHHFGLQACVLVRRAAEPGAEHSLTGMELEATGIIVSTLMRNCTGDGTVEGEPARIPLPPCNKEIEAGSLQDVEARAEAVDRARGRRALAYVLVTGDLGHRKLDYYCPPVPGRPFTGQYAALRWDWAEQKSLVQRWSINKSFGSGNVRSFRAGVGGGTMHLHLVRQVMQWGRQALTEGQRARLPPNSPCATQLDVALLHMPWDDPGQGGKMVRMAMVIEHLLRGDEVLHQLLTLGEGEQPDLAAIEPPPAWANGHAMYATFLGAARTVMA